VCQVRHELHPDIAGPSTVLTVKQLLPALFTRIEQVQMADIVLGFGANPMPPGSPASGWKLSSDDERWTLQLMPDSYTLECTGYTSWTEFRTIFLEVTAALQQHFDLKIVNRLGLRYFDRIKRDGTAVPKDWRGLFDPGLLGVSGDEDFVAAQTVAQTNQEFVFNGVNVHLRTSCATDNTASSGYSMVLDTDCFDARAFGFAVDAIEGGVSELHAHSIRVFETVVTKALMDEFGGQE